MYTERNAIGDIELPAPKIKETGEHASDLLVRMAKENPVKLSSVRLVR